MVKITRGFTVIKRLMIHDKVNKLAMIKVEKTKDGDTRLPVSKLSLHSDEVHIWHASVDVSERCLEHFERVLSHDEVKRANRFHFECDRRRFIVAHGLLRYFLSCYCFSTPYKHSFDYNYYGKPGLSGNTQLHFNMSHSGKYVLYGFTRGREIGVDIEHVRKTENLELIINSYFSSREIYEFSKLSKQFRNKAFFSCWTRKEAYIKAQGKGLSLPLNQFSISFIPDEPVELLETQHNVKEKSRWSLTEIAVNAEYAAAVAVEGHNLSFLNRQWCW